MPEANTRNHAAFIWSVADLLRGDYKQSEYGKVILPFVVMRRLDCILEPTKTAVLAAHKSLPKGVDEETQDMILFGAAGDGIKVYNTSELTFDKLRGQDARQLHANLIDYIRCFSPNVRDIFLEKFLFTEQLKRLNDGKIRYREDIVDGIDNAVSAFQGLFTGNNFGKLLVRVSEDPTLD